MIESAPTWPADSFLAPGSLGVADDAATGQAHRDGMPGPA
jgi:hypothetical protein